MIERIVNLPTHIGGLTLFSENKDKNKSRKFQSTKANKVIELLKTEIKQKKKGQSTEKADWPLVINIKF